jgi:putative tricarboxylic transport membrane protein
MRTDRVAGGALAVLGVAVAAEASTFHVAFLTDPVGPRALPLLTAGILVLSGMALALRPGPEPAWPPPREAARLGGAVLALLVYAAVLPVAGFIPSTTLVVAGLALLFGASPLAGGAAAAALSTALWYLFVWALRLPLPLGSLWTR